MSKKDKLIKINFPAEFEMKVMVTDGERHGAATIGLGIGRLKTNQEVADRIKRFESEELPGLTGGFRLMNRKELLEYAAMEASGSTIAVGSREEFDSVAQDSDLKELHESVSALKRQASGMVKTHRENVESQQQSIMARDSHIKVLRDAINQAISNGSVEGLEDILSETPEMSRIKIQAKHWNDVADHCDKLADDQGSSITHSGGHEVADAIRSRARVIAGECPAKSS